MINTLKINNLTLQGEQELRSSGHREKVHGP